MSNSYFQFKQFIIHQDRCAMKVTTDGCLFGSLSPTLIKEERVINVLDIGTGTGLLSLMLAQAKHNAYIDAIEIDKDAFEQACQNVEVSPWGGRIKVFHADARDNEFPHKYDLIISNPPFYEKD
jgi:tRNA1Val (adenine37-N6)-methyltransferase